MRASGLLDTLSPQERRMQEVGTPGLGQGWHRGGGETWVLGRSGSGALYYGPALRPQSLFEVVTSEASYLRSLRLLTDTFVLSQALRDTLTPRDHHTLFSNVQRVQGVSERSVGSCPRSTPGLGLLSTPLAFCLSQVFPSTCPVSAQRFVQTPGKPGSLSSLLQVSRDAPVPCALFPPHQRPV